MVGVPTGHVPRWPHLTERKEGYAADRGLRPALRYWRPFQGLASKQHHAPLWRQGHSAWFILKTERTQSQCKGPCAPVNQGSVPGEGAETLAGTTGQGCRSLGVSPAAPQQQDAGSLSQSQSPTLLLPSSCGSQEQRTWPCCEVHDAMHPHLPGTKSCRLLRDLGIQWLNYQFFYICKIS